MKGSARAVLLFVALLVSISLAAAASLPKSRLEAVPTSLIQTKVSGAHASMPKYRLLDDCYPKSNPKKLLGGKIDAAWITNTCAIRISACFNCAAEKGHPGLKIPKLANNESITCAKGNNHIYRVKTFVPQYLNKNFGAPSIVAVPPKGQKRGVSMTPFEGKAGVIRWDTTGAWATATGHISLLRPNGETIEEAMTPEKIAEYFSVAIKVELWEADV